MDETSARFALPFIIPGQAQKEIFHNEALAQIDCALHPCVEGAPTAEPPPAPSEGQSWIVGAAPTGAWGDKADAVATWTTGGCRFVSPVEGMTAWSTADGCWLHWAASGWSDGSLPASRVTVGGQQVVGPRLPDVPSPSGGTVIDVEARAAVAALIATLKSHGLID